MTLIKPDGGMQTRRTAWVDVARGIGIILVVYGHALRGLVKAEILPGSPTVLLQDQIIYAFHMPLFFFLAGLWTEGSLRKGSRTYLRDKLWSVALPYFVWSIIEGALVMVAGRASNSDLSLIDLAQIGWRPIHHFWFLYALFLCQLAAALSLPRIWPLALLSLLGVIGPFWGYEIWGRALIHLSFFTLGIVAMRVAVPGLALTRKTSMIGVAQCWAVFAVLFLLLYHTDGSIPLRSWNRAEIIILAVPGVAGTVLLSVLLAQVRPLALLGQASMIIYVMHTIFTAATRTALRRFVDVNPLVALLICTTAGIAIPLAIYIIFARGNRLWLLGVQRPPLQKARVQSQSAS